MKRRLVLLILFIFTLPIFANDVDYKTIKVCYDSIVDSAYAVASNFISSNYIEYDDVTINVPENSSLPNVIIYNDLDVSKFNKSFLKETDKAILGIPNPIYDVAKYRFEIHKWKTNDVIISGASALTFQKGATLLSLINDSISGVYPKAAIVFDFTFTGNKFKEKVRIEGIFVASVDESQQLNLKPVKFTYNGESIDYSELV